MSSRSTSAEETAKPPTYAVGAVVRATGLSAHVLRAWERRYGAVAPERTAGGTRRYSDAELRRLKLLGRAVKAGHPISELARLTDAGIEAALAASAPPALSPREAVLTAIQSLDGREAERLLAVQFAALGPRSFALDVAIPLLEEVGSRWERGELSVASEHLASAILRSVLGAALRAGDHAARGAPMLFTTPSGERHEFGVLVAALVAMAAGVNAVYLGPDLPASEIAGAVSSLGAGAAVLGATVLPAAEARGFLSQLRGDLDDGVALWVGGLAAVSLSGIPGITAVRDLQDLERRAAGWLDSSLGDFCP